MCKEKDFNQLYKVAHELPVDRQKALRAALFSICGEMFAHLPTVEQLEKALRRVGATIPDYYLIDINSHIAGALA